MDKQDFCRGCVDRNRCQEAYRRLGESRSPSIVAKVVVAFLLPLLVFIVALAALERILADKIHTEGLRTLFSFLIASVITAGFVVAVKLAGQKLARKR